MEEAGNVSVRPPRVGGVDRVDEFAWRRPAQRLRPFVSSYVGYRTIGPAGLHQGVPSGHLTFIISLDGTVDVAEMPDPARPPESFTALVGGLHDRPAVISHDGRQHGLHLEVTWLGARALFGLPAGELAGAVVDLPALLGRRAGWLAERVAGASGWRARFAVLDAALAELLDDPADAPVDQPPADVAWAWRRLVRTGGNLPVGELARELGWSRRRFGEHFRREIGLPPKVAGRVIRFERVCSLLRSDHRPSLARAAAEAGYFDQAHLAREFRDLAGISPTAWLAENPGAGVLPSAHDPSAPDSSVQDTGEYAVAR